MSDAKAQHDVQDQVVIGSSAGGIEALSILLSTLPNDFPAPIVLAQHLDPSRPSNLDVILQRSTALAVQLVSGQAQLKSGTVYVVPSNRHVLIADSTVMLETDHAERPRPSIDRLLTTAAANYRDRLIAVILTGSGSDGAVGALEVKKVGGTVVIQNPATARYPSMPMALPPTAIDHVVNLEEIGPLLTDLLTGAPISETSGKTQGALRSILDAVNSQASIDFSQYKVATILRRIKRRMAHVQVATLQEYAGYLQRTPEEVGALVAAFLINVTQFFRDPEAFEYLRSEVLPQLIEQARQQDRMLRFWSAGCATGEEVYSLVMLITDMLGPEINEWNIKAFATDLDGQAIAFARNGIYPENALANLPDDYRERFFERMPGTKGYRINKMLRQIVIFGQQDLGRSSPFPRIHLVMCRNVLIYFTSELQEFVLNQFAFSLRPNFGYLFLGKAETVRATMQSYELVNKQWKVYRCVGDHLQFPRLRNSGRLELPARLLMTPKNQPSDLPRLVDTTSQAMQEHTHQRRLNDQVLRAFPGGIVVVDRSYQLISVNTAARRLLGIHEVGRAPDFLHAVRGIPYADVRATIDRVFREHSTLTLSDMLLDVANGGTGRFVTMSFVYLQVEAEMPDLCAISVTDVTDQVQTRQRLEAVQADQAKLLVDLEAANRRLIDANKELTDTNEELQVTNEELVLTQEELQATVEEFETTNEELQATNEELETSNEELQATNEELETTNEELRASLNELENVSGLLERERAQLIMLVEMAPFYIMVLDGPELVIEQIDRRFPRLVRQDQVRGRPMSEVKQLLWPDGQPIVDLALDVYHNNHARISPPVMIETVDSSGNTATEYYLFTLVPRTDSQSHVNGVIIYAANETRQQALTREKERSRLRLIFDRTAQVALALFDASSARLLIASPRYLDAASQSRGVDRAELIGRTWPEVTLLHGQYPVDEIWQAALSQQPAQIAELRLTIDGQETVWDWSLTPITDDQQPGQLEYVLVSAVEITGPVHVREEIQRLNDLKDEFLSSASHELRTPLTSSIGYVHILKTLLDQADGSPQPDQIERVHNVAEVVGQQLGRLNRLIGDLLDISRLQTGKLELMTMPSDLVDIVQQAIVEARGINDELPFVYDPPAGSISVDVDPQRMIQVIVNLLHNAQVYAAEGQRIDVAVSGNDALPNGRPAARIDVRDYGPGIPEDEQDDIFTRLRQGSNRLLRAGGGLGLGLYICRQIVELHGGTISVSSQPGSGSTFTIRLPLSETSGRR